MWNHHRAEHCDVCDHDLQRRNALALWERGDRVAVGEGFSAAGDRRTSKLHHYHDKTLDSAFEHRYTSLVQFPPRQLSSK